MAHQIDSSTVQPTKQVITTQPTTLNQLASQIKEVETDTELTKAKSRTLKMFCSWNV